MRAAIALAAALATAGCSPQATQPALDLDAWQRALPTASAERAAALYTRVRALPGETEPVSCAVCHGAQGGGNYGEEDPHHVAPRLAGLNAVYVGEQIRAYQSGTRQFALMQGMVQSLSAQDIADLAVYVHGLRSAGPKPPDASYAVLSRGQSIWAHGLPGTVASCASCHGADGGGKVLRSPEIAGQPLPYLIRQLRTMHDHGRRGSTPAITMTEVTRRLSNEDIVAVATYIASIEPVSARQSTTRSSSPTRSVQP